MGMHTQVAAVRVRLIAGCNGGRRHKKKRERRTHKQSRSQGHGPVSWGAGGAKVDRQRDTQIQTNKRYVTII